MGNEEFVSKSIEKEYRDFTETPENREEWASGFDGSIKTTQFHKKIKKGTWKSVIITISTNIVGEKGTDSVHEWHRWELWWEI